jgi:hypothetical protein
MNLEQLLNDTPKIHLDGVITWGLDENILHFIDKHVNENSRTLETGAGLSTVLFAIKLTNHTCIVPSREEIARIISYCKERRISLRKTNFLIDRSENALPRLPEDKLDLVLIDGCHGFPIPAIDWFYTAPKLRIGGIVIVDDTHIWTGLILKKFLQSEPEWRRVSTLSSSKAAAFVKIKENYRKEWDQQPFVIKTSKYTRILHIIQRSGALLIRGQFSTLCEKLEKQLKIWNQRRIRSF